MKKVFYKILIFLRRLFVAFSPDSNNTGRNWKMFSNKEYANSFIFDLLIDDKPCMISRFGSTEMSCLTNYIGVKRGNKSIVSYIKGKELEWWWKDSVLNNMNIASGFFPPTIEKLEMFCKNMFEDISQIDILGSWLKEEVHFLSLMNNTKFVVLEDLEPFFCNNPWTKALEGKKVLVVHPFVESIKKQYDKKDLIFSNNLLPNFELITLKAVQSLAGSNVGFKDWFEALEYMKTEIDKIDYDICIIGAGAYGMPLAAHVKRTGKKAFHLAGSTQLLFGIKGKRWEEFVVWPYKNLFNEHWIRPKEEERPQNAEKVENACYW